MKKYICIIIIFIFMVSGVFAQDLSSLANAYLNNFKKGSLNVKLELVNEAVNEEKEALAPFFHYVIDFLITDKPSAQDKSIFRQMAVLSLNQIIKYAYTEAKYSLWALFKIEPETSIRLLILQALAVTAAGDELLIGNLNKWLDEQNQTVLKGIVIDMQTTAECIRTLGIFGDESSFSYIFNAYIIGYADNIETMAKQALFSLKGNLKDSFLNIIKNDSIIEKKAALQLALEIDSLNDTEKAEIAEFALDVALNSTTRITEDKKRLRQIRDMAIAEISQMQWSKATALVIKHFETALFEYDSGITSKASLIDAIYCLGNVKMHDAAVKLSLYLDLLNNYTQNSNVYDERIVLAVIQSLGKLGDNVAFDYLQYVQFLNYSDLIKEEAKKARDSLKW